MDIVDAQVHLNCVGIDSGLVAMDALGIRSVLIDEYERVDEAGHVQPCHELGKGIYRPVSPLAEEASRRFPDRLAYLLRVHYRDPEVETVIRLLKSSPGARAIRVLIGNPVEVLDLSRGAYDRVFAAAQKWEFPVFVQGPHLAPSLPAILRKFPEVRFVLDHCGLPATPADFNQVLALSELNNVTLKWAHAPYSFPTAGYPFPELTQILRRAVDNFGPERIMWASDFTEIKRSTKQSYCWAEALFFIRDTPVLSSLEKEWVLGRTVRAILNWPATPINVASS